jgi:hypothetical protein
MSASNPESINSALKVASIASSALLEIAPPISASLIEEIEKEQKEKRKLNK